MTDLYENEAERIRAENDGLIIDTNLLIVYFIGRFDQNQLEHCNSTKGYNLEDVAIIAEVLKSFTYRLVFPNQLTETSNQVFRDLKRGQKRDFVKWLRNYFEELTEKYIPTEAAIERYYALDHDLADCVVLHHLENTDKNFFVFSEDGPLANQAHSFGHDSKSMAEIQSKRWGIEFDSVDEIIEKLGPSEK